MASSKVMSSTSPPNPDLPRHSAAASSSSIHYSSSPQHHTTTTITTTPAAGHLLHHHSDQSNSSPFGSMNMEEILNNIYSESDSLSSAVDGGGGGGSITGVSAVNGAGVVKNIGTNKTVDEVWKEIVSGSQEPRMTLEDFLTKAGAVSEEDVRASTPVPPPAYGLDPMMNVQFPVAPGLVVHMQNEPGGLGYGNGMVAAAAAAASAAALGGAGANGSAAGRGKRRAVPAEEVADKATQQKQRRMIKNRESAARSRERKQAYTGELESLVTQLEEENGRLLREEAEQTRARYRQLMENLVPVVERQRPPPPRVLGRQKSW